LKLFWKGLFVNLWNITGNRAVPPRSVSVRVCVRKKKRECSRLLSHSLSLSLSLFFSTPNVQKLQSVYFGC